MTDLQIKGGTVITMDDERSIVEADVYVDAGRIVAIGGPQRPARRTIDATGMVVIPGLINLHDHLRDLTPGIRIGEGLKIDELLRAYWRLTEAMGVVEYRVGAMLGAARLVRAGVTSVVDHVYPFHVPGLAESTVAGYEAVGIRWFMARGIMTQPYEPICETEAEAFRGIDELSEIVPTERPLSSTGVAATGTTRALCRGSAVC